MNSTLIRRESRVDSPLLSSQARRWPPGLTVAAGAFFACMSGIHIGFVGADPQLYAWFGEEASWRWVQDAWADVFMAQPVIWGLVAAALEICLATLLLLGGRPAKTGWVGVIAFQFALVLFGWDWLVWSVPAAVVLFLGARASWSQL